MNGRGIVLRHRPWGEADRLVSLFSREAGLRTLVARGAARPGSALAGRTEPLTEITYFAKPARRLTLLTQARETAPFLEAKRSPAARARAFVVLEILSRLYPEGRDDAAAYDLSLACLTGLDRAGVGPDEADLALAWFKLRLLDHEGMTLRADTCLECGRDDRPTSLSESGDVLCPACLGRRGGAPLSRAADLLARIAALDPAEGGFPPAGRAARAAKSLVDRFFAARTGLSLLSERLLNECPPTPRAGGVTAA